MFNDFMDKKEARKRIEKLKKEINHHRYLYHVLDSPEVPDEVFDSLKNELALLEEEFPEFIAPDSPTQRVGGEPLEKFEKVEHGKPMLSLHDIFSFEDLEEWSRQLKDWSGESDIDFFCELKIDGFAVSLEYEKGLFKRGSTRGDGRIGEDVTQNLKTIEAIPLRLTEDVDAEIRGEVYMTKKALEKLNKQRVRDRLEPFANPRNTAAGSIRQLDPKVAAGRELSFMAYGLFSEHGQKTHQESHEICKRLGFKVEAGAYCENINEVRDYYEKVENEREKLPFEIDGIVISVNNNKLFDRLGVVGKGPRGARALKFSAVTVATKLENIIIQVGRTGVLTPVAVLKPVKVGGVTISRATLHNIDEIEKKDVRIGDTVVVQRAGDVIPEVVQSLPRLRSGEEKIFKMPKKCPVCGGQVIRPEGEAAHRCANSECGAIRRKRLYHFVSKNAFDIAGLGPQIIDQLLDEGVISDIPDIFEIEEAELLPLERFAEKSATNLIKSIEKSKNVSLPRFIYSLGIRYVGEETAFDLANYFGGLNKIAEADINELRTVPGVGEKVAVSLAEWFKDKNNLKIIEKLEKAGVLVENIKASKKLQGKTFVLTGSLATLTRDEAKKKIRMAGGDVSSSVSKETDFVVVGEEPGSKYKKAKDLGVKILSEKEFSDMLK